MFIPVEKSADKETNYQKLLETLPYYLNADEPWYTTLSNAAGIIDYFLDDVNWVGFYIREESQLFLGPFQGLPACTKIFFGRGVCGTAAEKGETVVVRDVDAFEGHIACDSNSKSEIVVPLFKSGVLFGVLDIDSPEEARFDATDRLALEKVARVIVDNLS
ncbi:MAG: GAF domain-containing protein [Candidatus Izemoplasmataceae bacterium]